MQRLELLRIDTSPLRVLCLGAHSDDIEIGCAGTILALRRRHSSLDFRWVVFSANKDRAKEARKSALRVIGREDGGIVDIYSFRDGYFPFEGDRIKDIFENLKNEFDPHIIFTHYREDRHQDHRVICDLTWNTYRDHLVLEYEIPKYDGDFGVPNVFVDLEEAIVDEKVKILVEEFGSQSSKRWFRAETFRSALRLRGMEIGTDFAEAFYGRKLRI